jgi:hypothetical protein
MNASFGDGGIDLMHLGAILHKLSWRWWNRFDASRSHSSQAFICCDKEELYIKR